MEEVILKSLMTNGDFYAKVFTYLKPDHFEKVEHAEILKSLKSYVKKYDERPNIKELGLFIKNSNELNDTLKKEVLATYKSVMLEPAVENQEFLIEEVERWIQKQELTEAIFKSADLIEKNEAFEPIIGMIEKALSVNLDTDVGLNFRETIEDRYEYYTQRIDGESTGIPSVDKALGGGLKPKTLSVAVAPSHGGKTSILISTAVTNYLKGKNVLFLSLEMPDLEIARRIDANLLNHPANELWKYPKEQYKQKLEEISSYAGTLVIKDYPSGVMNVLMLTTLLNELKTKEGFEPDIIIIDYIALMSSVRTTIGQAGGYAYYKSIAEELHGFSKKRNLPVLTAAQLNRSAYNSLDAGMDTIADSLGVIQTADVVIAMLSNDQLREMNQSVIKLLKNRNTGRLSSHLVEVDFSTVRFTDMEEDSTDEVKTMNAHALNLQRDASKVIDTGVINYE